MTREDIMKLAEHQGLVDYFDLDGDSVGELMLCTLVRDCVAAEREACAKACEDAISSIWEFHPEYVNQVGKNVCTNLAAAIRARGQA